MIPAPPELDPATSPDMLQIPYQLGVWEWVAIIILLIIGVFTFLIVRAQRTPVIPPTPGDIAKEQIRRLMAASPDLKTASTELSLILRSYFAGKSEDPALFETHQEFNRRANALAALPERVQNTARDLLQQMAHLKYSHESKNDSELARSLFDQSLQLIDSMEHDPTPRNPS